jgi:MscS family membrane protein
MRLLYCSALLGMAGNAWALDGVAANALEPPEQHWLFAHLPSVLLQTGPLGLLYWHWAALPLLGAVAWVLGRGLGWIARRILARLASRTTANWDDRLLARLAGPIHLACFVGAAEVLSPWLGLYGKADHLVDGTLRGLFLVCCFWAALRAVDVTAHALTMTPWAATHGSLRALLPLASRVVKAAVVAMAAVALLSQLGYPVASLIAGLGIGGLAFALAAQKTVENLFGAFSLGVDQPFREGDFVKIDDFVGNVESVGLRSTRVRTLDRTLITIPNGKLADTRIESFAVRDRIRLACTVGLTYDTNAQQMRTVLEGLERVLRAHPKIWPDAVVVRFSAFGPSSLDIEVMAWFQTPDWGEFQLIRQNVLLQFMEVVERAGSSFAFPTQTVHVVQDSAS